MPDFHIRHSSRLIQFGALMYAYYLSRFMNIQMRARARGRGPSGFREAEAEVPPSPRTSRATAGLVLTLFEKVALLYSQKRLYDTLSMYMPSTTRGATVVKETRCRVTLSRTHSCLFMS